MCSVCVCNIMQVCKPAFLSHRTMTNYNNIIIVESTNKHSSMSCSQISIKNMVVVPVCILCFTAYIYKL